MSIHFRSGKPGGGKTLKAFSDLVDLLKSDDKRPLVTNITIDLDKLQHYLHDLDISLQVSERVYLLDEDQTRSFYLYRGPLVLDCPPIINKGDEDLMPDYRPSIEHPVAGRGVVYFIDEIHLFFNSREWMKTGKRAIYYLSQHRKLNDTVHCITQSINNVDKQFRSLAQDFSYVRNHRVEKFKGFRRGNGFVETVYLQPVTSGLEEPSEKHTFSLDLKLADCYRTAGGVGLPGSNAGDAGRKVKGLALKWVWVGLGVALLFLCWLLFQAPKLGRTAAESVMSGKPQSQQSQVKSEVKSEKAYEKAYDRVAGTFFEGGDTFVSLVRTRGKSSWLKVICRFDKTSFILEDGTRVFDVDMP